MLNLLKFKLWIYKTKQNKTNTILVFLKFTILLACLIFYNCQKDDDIQNIVITEEKVDRPVTVSTIPQNQFIDNNRVWSKIGALKTELAEFSKTSQNRTVHSNETGLSIDTDFATYIEFENGYHSYTFLVTNTPAGEGLQNILLSLQDDGSYKEFLVHYNITDDEIVRLDDGEIVNLINRYTMTEIEGGFSEQLFSKVLFQDDCTLMEYIPDTCSSGNHVYGEACEYDEDDGNPNTNPAPNSGEITITELLCAPGGNPQGGEPSNGGTPPPYNPGNNHGGGSSGNTSSPTTSCKGKCGPVDVDPMCDATEPLTGPAASLELSSEERCFLLRNGLLKSIIDHYLGQNNGNKKFAEAAVVASMDNDDDGQPDGEVDWDKHIVYDSSLKNYPCHKIVIEDAIGTCSPLTQLVLDAFEANDYVNLVIKTSNAITGNATTSSVSTYDSINQNCNITITFRESYLQTATDLSIARTAIHESLHAILVYMYEENLLFSQNGVPLVGFENFVEAYANYLSGLPENLGVAHHVLMSDFIEDMATSLSAYASDNGHSNSFNFYKRLCWSGDLINTPTFQSLYPKYLVPTDATNNPANVNPDYLDIINTNAAEQNNASYSYPHPNGTTYQHSPIGNAPNSNEPCN